MKFAILGVYYVEESEEPCFLIEARISDFVGDFDFGKITQKVKGQPQDNWQVPWDEYVLSEDGTSGKNAPFPKPTQIDGTQRIAFMMYYIDFDSPLITPFGNVDLPELTHRPARLSFIGFEPPY